MQAGKDLDKIFLWKGIEKENPQLWRSSYSKDGE